MKIRFLQIMFFSCFFTVSVSAMDQVTQLLRDVDPEVVGQAADALSKAVTRIGDLEKKKALNAKSLCDLLNTAKPSWIPMHHVIRGVESCIEWSDGEQHGWFERLRSYPAGAVVWGVKRFHPEGEKVVDAVKTQIQVGEPISDLVGDTNRVIQSIVPEAIRRLKEHQDPINRHLSAVGGLLKEHVPSLVFGLRAMQQDMQARQYAEFHDAQDYFYRDDEFHDAQEYSDDEQRLTHLDDDNDVFHDAQGYSENERRQPLLQNITVPQPSQDLGMSYWCG